MEKRGSIFTLIISFILAFIVYEEFKTSDINVSVTLFRAYMIMGLAWGWRVLSFVKFEGLFKIHIVGLIIYLLVKFGGGLVIGFLTTPYYIFITIKDIFIRK